jgi:hypothetical protein
MAIILKANKVNLFVSSVLFVFWYHSPNFLDTRRMCACVCVYRACVCRQQQRITQAFSLVVTNLSDEIIGHKMKVKITLQQATKAQRRSKRIALLFL